jgi:hypothetical protein
MAKITLRSWTNCDELLGKMAALQAQIDKAKGDYQPQIDTMERELRELCDPLEAELSEYREAVEKFAIRRADEFDGRSKELTNGTIKLTASSSVEISDEAACVKELQKLKLTNCIKATFKPVKAAIKGLADDIMRQIGAAIVTVDKVTIDLLTPAAEPAKAKKAKK